MARHGQRSRGRRGWAVVFALMIGLAAPIPQAWAEPPANDNVSAAAAVASVPASVFGRTSEATMEADEPRPLATVDDSDSIGLDRSVWFAYTSAASMKLLAETCDANFASHIDVYSGQPGALTPVPTEANDYRACPGDRRSFAVTKGTPYLVRVTALRFGRTIAEGGVFHLDLSPQVPPGNDAFARASVLRGPTSVSVPLAFSTIEFGEPTGYNDAGSVWYRLRPRVSQPFTAEVGVSPFETTLTVFSAAGHTIDGLHRLGSDYAGSEYRATVSFNGLEGNSYYLRIATAAQVPAPVTLSLTTNTAAGLGVIVTPLRNTLRGVRSTGFRASLSCARTCRLSAELLIAPRDVRKYRLSKNWPDARKPLRVGRVGGTLQTGRPQTVIVPIDSRAVRRSLAHATPVHYILRVGVRGARRSKPVTRVILLRR